MSLRVTLFQISTQYSEILEPNASVLGKLLIYWALRSNPAGTNEEKNVRFSLI